MPTINKVRITGVRYDNFRKGYEDTIIDFTRNDEPDHTLITLVNQGGKGVLMQLLSQITMPDTRWGKESGNRIISMFYDRHRTFRPYTFHVVIEWKLDTTPCKWLVTGICVTAVKRNASDEQEEKTGLNYFHYTVEHDNSGFFSISALPLYDSKNQCPVSYDAFEDYIDHNSKYMVKYPMSQTRRLNSHYFEYLKSRGIHRAEWEMMKVINRDEGGVRNYFSKATDNKSVIDRMLITSITQNMSNYNENAGESLKEMFLSNLSITRDLPRLIERENDYRELLLLISPLLDIAESGLKVQSDTNRHIREGNSILSSLGNMLERVEDEKKGWVEKKKEAQAERVEYDFQRDNLEYAKSRRTKLEKQKEQETILTAINDARKGLNEQKEKEKYTRVDILLKKRGQCIEGRESNARAKQELIDKLGIQNVQEEIRSLEKVIRKKWMNSKAFFETIVSDHQSYQMMLKKRKNELASERRSQQKRLEAVQLDLSLFQNRLKKHQEEFDTLAQFFDVFRMAMPEYLLQELLDETKQLKEQEAGFCQQIQKGEEEKKTAEYRQYSIRLEIERDKKEMENLNQSFQKARQNEAMLKQKICTVSGLDAATVEYTHQWAKGRINALKVRQVQEEKRLDELKTQMWSVNMDLGINQGDYWIPNHDIQGVKEQIIKSGVYAVMTGTEFLHGFELETRQKMVSAHPLLPYGIILPSQKEWQMLQRNMDKAIFLRAAVPVFVRSEMEESGFKSIKNAALKLAVDEKVYKDWLNQLQEKATDFQKIITTVEQKRDAFLNIGHEITTFVKQPESSEIWQQYRLLKEETEKKEKELEQVEIQQIKIQEQLNSHEQQLLTVKGVIQQNEEKETKLSVYVDEENKIKALKPEVSKKEQMKEALEKEIHILDQNIDKASRYEIDDQKDFESWKVQIAQKLEGIRSVISDSFIRYDIKPVSVLDTPPEYNLEDPGKIFDDLQQINDLSREAEQKNAQILIYDERIRSLDEKIKEFEEELHKLLNVWRDRESPTESLGCLRQILVETGEQIEQQGKVLYHLEMDSKSIEGELTQLDHHINQIRVKIRERHNKTPEPWDQTDLQAKEYEITRNMIAAKKKLDSIEDFIQKADKKIYHLSLSFSSLKGYEELEADKGRADDAMIKRLEEKAGPIVESWQNEYRSLKRRLTDSENSMRKELESFRREIRERIQEKILFEKLNTEIQNIRVDHFKGNLESFTSMKEHFQREMESTSTDKAKAEQVREQWAHRAAKHIIRIIELMKEMVRGMTYINHNNYSFPLIKLKGEEYMPSTEEEILVLLKEHFVQSINQIIKQKLQVEDIDAATLDNLMGDQALFSKAVRGRYPVLMVYKMTEKNEFQYAKPHDYYYASWEALNRGEEGSAEGSGGQKLAISTFMMMMLVNYKKRTSGSHNPWTVLMMDNPFGQASAKHILDPVFEIASSLNFQLVAFAPPEIIKIEISKRFPVFWELRIEDSTSNQSSLVTGRLIHGGRKMKLSET